MTWLLTPEATQALRLARTLAHDYRPTLEERARFEVALRERYTASDSSGRPRIMAVAGDVAEIRVEGILTEEPDCLVMLFGGGNTTYRDIQKAVRSAEADPAVKRILLRVNSPGGEVAGLFETLAVLESATKDITVEASFAASAAYALAAMAGPIKATTPASEFGSIGVAVSLMVDESVIDLASTEAPKKRPDVTTEDGKATVIERLDALHELFADAIARGRTAATGKKVTVAQVNAEFGRGAVVTAEQARSRGMIDSLAKQPKRTRARAVATEDEATPEAASAPRVESEDQQVAETPPATASSEGATEKADMTLETLKAQYPELYSAIFAEGEKQGEAKERKRVTAHLKLGKTSGAMDLAEKAVASGVSPQDDEVFADYQAAAMNRRDQTNRQADSDKAGAALGAPTTAPADPKSPAPAAANTPEGDLGDKVADALDARLGPPKAKSNGATAV